MGVAAFLACIAVSPTGVVQTSHETARAYRAVFLHPDGYWTSTAQGAGGGVQVGRAYRTNGHQIPVMWRGSPGSVQSLLPLGIESGTVYSTDGVSQGGRVQAVENQSDLRAALWRGSSQTYIDLSEPSWEWSDVFSVDGLDQVGRYVPTFLGRSQAVAWRGTRESRVLLTPPGFRDAGAGDVCNGQAIGGGTTPDSEFHAIYWPSLNATSAILFEPHEFYSLGLNGLAPGQQVGTVTRGFRQPVMATIFRGSPTDYTIIHPIGYEYSFALATNGKTQVGYAELGTKREACAWWGSRGSFVSLHALLPREYVKSEAYDIADDGTIVGEAWKANYVGPFAVSWQVLGVGRVALKGLPWPGFLGIGVSVASPGLAGMQQAEVLVGTGYEPSVACNERREPTDGRNYVTLVQYMTHSAQYNHTIKRAYSRDRGDGWDFPNDELRAEDRRGLDPSVAASLNGGQFVMTWLQEKSQGANFKAWQRRTLDGLNLLGSYEPVFDPIGDRAWIAIGDKPYYSYATGLLTSSYSFLKGDFVGGVATWPASVTSTSMTAASGANLVPHPAVAAGRTVGASRFAYVMGLQAVNNDPAHTDNRYLIARSSDGGATWGGQPFTLATLGDTYDGFVYSRDRPMSAYHVVADPPHRERLRLLRQARGGGVTRLRAPERALLPGQLRRRPDLDRGDPGVP